MRQYDFGWYFLGSHHFGLVRVGSQINQMCDRLSDFRTINTTLRKHTANNGILIALWDIPASDHDVVQEEPRIGAVLSRIGEFALRQRIMDPGWFDNGNESIAGCFVGRKVDGVGHKMGELGRRWELGRGFIDDSLAAILFEA